MSGDIITRLNEALEGRYEVVRPLGEGGMATVFLADDVRHGRKVALKVLKPELAAMIGGERFVAEIKTTANLQHPHILPLFDSGEADGFLFYVMPYVEGETLRQRLDRETQLGIEDAVRITTHVADALDYAHRQGVIHRDIKPANILLHEGNPVVADFGIALAVSAAGGGRMTETGLSLGTPHYMSPEQATADRDLTARSDVYSLGCVLYEMLSGDPPHTGSSAPQVIAKIVTDDARPVSELRKTVPPNVAAAVAKAVEKLPADRFDGAAAFAEALANPTFTLARRRARGVAARHSGGRSPATAAFAALSIVMTAAAVWGWQDRSASGSAPVYLSIVPPPDHVFEDLGSAPGVAVSPSGATVAFVARDGETSRIFVRRLGGSEAVPLPGTENGWGPFFSPDGEWIGFFAEGALRKVSLTGGNPQTITSSGDQGGGSWGSDGWIVFDNWPLQGVWRAPEGGGPAELIEGTEDAPVMWPQVLPDEKGILFTRLGSREFTSLSVYDYERGEVFEVIQPAGYGRFVEPGYIVYAWAGELLAVEFDVDRLETVGTPQPVLQGVMTDRVRPRLTSTSTAFLTGAVPHFAVGEAGSLVFVPGTNFVPARSLAWLGLDGSSEEIPLAPGEYAGPRLSPDGGMLAFLDRREGHPFGVSTYDLRRGIPRPFTDSVGGDFWPLWRPDGEALLFPSNRYSQDTTLVNIYQRRLDGDGGYERLSRFVGGQQPQAWTGDGSGLVFTQAATGQNQQLFVAPLDSVDAADSLALGVGRKAHPSVSPDGAWLAYASDGTGRAEVYVRRFDGTGPGTQVSTDGGHEPIWGSGGETLYFRDYSGDRIFRTSLRLDGEVASVAEEPDLILHDRLMEGRLVSKNYDFDPVAMRFLVVREPLPPRALHLEIVLGFLRVVEAAVGN